MSTDYLQLVYEAILDEQSQLRSTFAQAIFSGVRKGEQTPWERVELRPVAIKGVMHVQFSQHDGRKCIAKNYADAELKQQLEALLRAPFRNLHVVSIEGELQINISKSGKPIIHRSKRLAAKPVNLSHNRPKEFLLPEGKADPFLQAIGFMTRDGQIRADRQKKFKQINEFLKFIQQTGEIEKITSEKLRVVDFGCGNAYLTFAVFHYLNNILQRPTELVGVDVQGDLVEKHAGTVQILGWEGIHFQKDAIAQYRPAAPPDIVIALHACDTATDEALQKGIGCRAKMILSVPCCHHHLQVQLGANTTPEAFRPVMRHGILLERMGDILTDAFRALILRIMGYETDVIQFVSSEHTAKNLMIRAIYRGAYPSESIIAEYTAMKAYWGVTPYLETLLGDEFAAYIK